MDITKRMMELKQEIIKALPKNIIINKERENWGYSDYHTIRLEEDSRQLDAKLFLNNAGFDILEDRFFDEFHKFIREKWKDEDRYFAELNSQFYFSCDIDCPGRSFIPVLNYVYWSMTIFKFIDEKETKRAAEMINTFIQQRISDKELLKKELKQNFPDLFDHD